MGVMCQTEQNSYHFPNQDILKQQTNEHEDADIGYFCIFFLYKVAKYK